MARACGYRRNIHQASGQLLGHCGVDCLVCARVRECYADGFSATDEHVDVVGIHCDAHIREQFSLQNRKTSIRACQCCTQLTTSVTDSAVGMHAHSCWSTCNKFRLQLKMAKD